MENRVASKLAFYSSRMAETSGGVNSCLIHLIHSSFSQEFVFLHVPLLSSQLNEGGRGKTLWRPFQQEGTAILCQAPVTLGQLCLLRVTSCHSHQRSLRAQGGGGYFKDCLLASLPVTCYIL